MDPLIALSVSMAVAVSELSLEAVPSSSPLRPEAAVEETEAGRGNEGNAAAEMARKLQDPLANVKLLSFDNDILFNTGQGQESYSFNMQPVYAIPMEERGINLVLRGMFPFVGMASGSQKPIVPDPLPPDSGLTWGLGDSIMQSFVSPRTDAPWKWGIGPMVSLKTRTDSDLAGPGWGAGLSGMLVGNVTENLSTSFLAGQLWGDEDSFSTSIIQPMLFYNVESVPGPPWRSTTTIRSPTTGRPIRAMPGLFHPGPACRRLSP